MASARWRSCSTRKVVTRCWRRQHPRPCRHCSRPWDGRPRPPTSTNASPQPCYAAQPTLTSPIRKPSPPYSSRSLHSHDKGGRRPSFAGTPISFAGTGPIRAVLAGGPRPPGKCGRWIDVIGPPRAGAGLLSRSHRGPFGKIEEAIPNGPAVARHPQPFAAGAAAVRGSSRRRGSPERRVRPALSRPPSTPGPQQEPPRRQVGLDQLGEPRSDAVEPAPGRKLASGQPGRLSRLGFPLEQACAQRT